MRIGELAKATGVDVETIRYYEKSQLLSAPTRSDNGYRAYTQVHLERLAFIRHCRALDMPLADVQRLLTFVDSPPVRLWGNRSSHRRTTRQGTCASRQHAGPGTPIGCLALSVFNPEYSL